jgi:putative DNA primase/helicase
VINTASILSQFRTAAAARGLLLPDRLDADGKLHRCELRDGAKGKKDGAYLLHLDGVPAGGFQNFRDGLDWENWRADIGRQLTPEEESTARVRMETQRAEREAEAKAKRDKARRKANAIWNGAKPAPDDHPYLTRKGVPSFGLRVASWPKWVEARPGQWEETRIGNALLVPMRSPSGTLHSLQAIYPEKIDGRDKDFLPHGEKAGKFHLIGEISADVPLCVAEGYATAASLHQVTGWPVAVAFDAGSLDPVARALREAHPAASMIVCADDDHQTDGNPGRTKAEAAARAVGGVVAVPNFGPDRPIGATDFNDLSTSSREGEGPDAVRRILDAARDAIAGAACDDAPPAVPTSGPEAENAASAPESTPATPEEKPAAPAKRSRSKPKAKADGVQTPAQGGDVFELRDGNEGRGVYRLKVEKRGDTWSEVAQFVCAPLEITHQVRDARGENWQRLATFNDHDCRRRRVLVPDEMLEGDGAALARLLRSQGLFIGDNKGGLLKMYVNRSRPPARARLTSRIGWHDDYTEPGRWSFVLGGDHDPLAPEGAELWLHQAQGSGHAQFKTAGTLADWRDNVAALAVGNSRLLFALSAGFAGGLCWLHPNVSGGFHWAGGSSLGKSALLYGAASLCGPANYRRTWLLTATAIEGVAAGHCDAPLLLDELKQAGNPKDVAQAAYMLTSGQGKGRGQAAGGLRETASFSLLFQSNGEIGLTQFLEENQERAYAGQEVRFCELPADAGAGFGCWDALHGLADGARFSETLQRNAGKHYGTVYPEFIRRVIAHREALPSEFETLRTSFEKHGLSEKAGGQAIRAATRFAAVAYAGEKATEWGLTGWPQGEAVKACMRMFKDWLHAFGGEENREPRKMVEQVQAWIQAHAGARLEDWRRPSISDTHAPRTMNRAGWKRPTKDTAFLNEKDHVFEYLIYPEVFKRELCNGFDPAQVVKELLKAGLLERGDGKNIPVKVREPGAGGFSRLLCINPGVLGWGSDHD